jgi:hypothetical protein
MCCARKSGAPERTLLAHRTHCETTYAAKSWGKTKRRVFARIEATTLGLDIRTIVTAIQGGHARAVLRVHLL